MTASIFVVGAMFVLFETLTGPSSGDWLGYARLYADQGGWLLDQRRDPGFLLILDTAHSLFGRHGYASFRVALSIIFVLFSVWLVCSMPPQERAAKLTSMITALIVVSSFSLKGFVQIREGIAFLFVLAPLVPIFARHRNGALVSGFGSIAALTFHSAMMLFTGAWIISLALLALPNRILVDRNLRKGMLGASLVFGVGLGTFIISHATQLRFLLGDFGVNVHVKAQGSSAKYLYWLLNGVLVWKVRDDLGNSLVGIRRFGYCYGTVIASGAIPAMYAICVTLVVSNFSLPAFTSMAIRLFFTATEIGVIILALRGRANFATVSIAIFMLLDRLRLAALDV